MRQRKDQELQKIVKALLKAEHSQDIPTQIRLYVKLTKLLPEHAVAHARAASLLDSQDQQPQALVHIQRALALPVSDEVDAIIFPLLSKRADILLQELQLTHDWFQAHPNYWRLQLLALALIKHEQFAQAQQLIEKALEHPDYTAYSDWLLLTLAHVFYCLCRFHESIACCQLVLENAPSNQGALYSLANNYNKLAQYARAIELYEQVLALDPNNIDAHHHLAHLMLKLGSFKQGWKHWEWRWAKSIAHQVQNFNIPEWNGESLNGKRLLVWSEQGIGDQIMFASMLPDLLAQTPTIAWEGDARLRPLFTRSMPTLNFIETSPSVTGKKVLKLWPTSDVHIPAGSLGKILREDISQFPLQKNFLHADAYKTDTTRNDYKERFPGKLLVGISWRGGKSAGTNKYVRSLRCSEMLPLAQLTHIQFINLQYGDCREELAELAASDFFVYDDPAINPLLNLDDQAAQIAALDLVLSVDNTTVHLAGALGVKTYLLLPTDPDWRWGIEQKNSYWYPSVRFIRNTDPSNWIKAIKTAIEVISDSDSLKVAL